MQLRSGHETHGALTHQDEEALMMELYPTPDPESQRIAAEDIELAVKGIDNDLSLTDEQRLHELHCMLELCAAEHEREAQEYQAAHRHLIEHEARVSVMTTYPDIPEHIFDDWTAFLDTKMGEDRSKMEYSRANTEALLNVIRIVEDLGASCIQRSQRA